MQSHFRHLHFDGVLTRRSASKSSLPMCHQTSTILPSSGWISWENFWKAKHVEQMTARQAIEDPWSHLLWQLTAILNVAGKGEDANDLHHWKAGLGIEFRSFSVSTVDNPCKSWGWTASFQSIWQLRWQPGCRTPTRAHSSPRMTRTMQRWKKMLQVQLPSWMFSIKVVQAQVIKGTNRSILKKNESDAATQ